MNVLCIWGRSSWSCLRLQGLIPAEFQYFWIFFDATCALDGLVPSPKMSWCLLVSWNALERLLFIRVWGWMSDTWQSLIGDTCHSLIGLLMSLLTRAELHMSLLTRAKLLMSSLMSSLTHTDVWLVFLHAFYASISMTFGKFLLVSE